MRRTFKFGILSLLLFVSGFGSNPVAIAQTDRRVEAIRLLCQKTDGDIARSEESPEISSIFLTELAVNKNNGPYPAVGIYRPVIKFYYTYGDREKEPYPNRLLKIIVSIDRSDRKEYSEFVFNEAGQLVFYFERKDGVERRLYLVAERPIRFQQGDRVLSLRTHSPAAIVATVLNEKASLVAIFRRSWNF